MTDDLTVYGPETISDVNLPTENTAVSAPTDPSTASSSAPTSVAVNPIPTPRIAVDVISQVLNTKTLKIIKQFTFTPSGAIQIGDYTQGVSGDIRISPAGIVARNLAGNQTFALDGDTGDAVFAGQLQTGSIVTGLMVVGDNGLILDGQGRNIIVNDGTNDRVLIGFQQGGY